MIMNWKRPQNVLYIVSQLVLFDEVHEVMIMNNREGVDLNSLIQRLWNSIPEHYMQDMAYRHR